LLEDKTLVLVILVVLMKLAVLLQEEKLLAAQLKEPVAALIKLTVVQVAINVFALELALVLAVVVLVALLLDNVKIPNLTSNSNL
jgi:hypothetical protein